MREGNLLYGPLRAWGKREISSIRDVRHTSVAGDMKVSCKSTSHIVNQGGTADIVYSSLTDFSVEDFFCGGKTWTNI